MLRCSRCGHEKDESLFGKDKRRKNGRTIWCLQCSNEYKKSRYDPLKESIRKKKQKLANPERYAEIDRLAHLRYRKRHRDRLRKKWREDAKSRPYVYNREVAIRAIRKWQKANRDKVRCQDRARRAEKLGNLISPKQCEICGIEGKLQKHHHDYAKPLEVVWCCTSCHGKLDRIRREQELLNNKEQHG